MAERGPAPFDDVPGLGALISRLIEDGRGYAQAEIALYKAIAKARLAASVIGIALIAVALVLVLAAVTVLLLSLGLVLGKWLGLIGGVAAGGVIGLLLAAILVKIGVSQLGGGKA